MIVLSIPIFSLAEEAEPTRIPEEETVVLTPRVPIKQPTILDNGSVVVASVESYDIREKSVSACSYIARNNIVLLLESMGVPSTDIARGDANDLIRSGRIYGTLTSFTQKEALLDALTERHNAYVETVFDVYRFVGRRPPGLQWHRVAVFLWDDNEWYILDPLDGKKTREPQLFREFLANDVEAEWLVRFPGYSMMNLVTDAEFAQALPYFSPELRAFFQTYHLDMPMLALHSASDFQQTL
jgi:hypothetical protein